MILGYDQVAVTSVVKTASDLSVPSGATHALLQAETASVRYTMDESTPSSTRGMLLIHNQPPEQFLIEDLLRIKFTRSGESDCVLNVHYSGGRSL